MIVEAIVRAYLAAFADGDPSAIAAHVSDGFVNEHTAALGVGSVGRDAYAERLGGFLAEMVGLEYVIEDLLATDAGTGADEGDESGRAFVSYRMAARWRGIEAFEVRGVQRLVVTSGLISQRTDYWDAAKFLGQVDAEAAATLAGLGMNIN